LKSSLESTKQPRESVAAPRDAQGALWEPPTITGTSSSHTNLFVGMSVSPRREFLPSQAAQSARRASKAQKMLERLKCGSATTWELMQIGGAGFSSRLHELRGAGHRINCEQHEDGAVYRLVG
jgi:hypothetical protein